MPDLLNAVSTTIVLKLSTLALGKSVDNMCLNAAHKISITLVLMGIETSLISSVATLRHLAPSLVDVTSRIVVVLLHRATPTMLEPRHHADRAPCASVEELIESIILSLEQALQAHLVLKLQRICVLLPHPALLSCREHHLLDNRLQLN